SNDKKCTKCEFVAITTNELKRHLVVHSGERFFTCEHCEYVCRNKKTVQEHQLKEHNAECINPDSKVKCTKCDYVAINTRELKRHSVVHTGEKFFTCEHCGYVCKYRSTLRKHQLKQHKNSKEKKCTKCEFVATTRIELNRHSIVHSGERFFTCEHCEYVCKHKKTLQEHQLKEHNAECINPDSKVKCMKCDYVAINTRELKRHSVVHTGEQFFTCEHCGYVCKNESTMRKHQLKHHQTGNEKKCTKCEFVAITTIELKRHLIIHSGERFFTCEHCEYVCKNKKSLKKHQLKDHNAECIIPDSKEKISNNKMEIKCEPSDYIYDNEISFENYQSLKIESIKEELPSDTLWLCTICDYMLKLVGGFFVQSSFAHVQKK
ncbi:unnamed protein product, partial [Meganyctiphanes norvegica]